MHASHPAANSDSFTVTLPSDREIRMTRLFDAPRELVFEAMTKPEHIKNWWGRLGDGYSVGSIEVRDIVRSTGMERGAAISYDRLEDLVGSLRG